MANETVVIVGVSGAVLGAALVYLLTRPAPPIA